MSKLGNYLRDLRKQRNLTLRKVEHLTGISNSFISQVELGTRKCSSDLLLKLAEAYEVPPSELLELSRPHGDHGDEAEPPSDEIDYAEAFRQIMRQQLGEATWSQVSPEYERVPLGLKIQLVKQNLAKSFPVESSVRVVISHSQNKFSGTIKESESDLRGGVLIRGNLAAQLLHPFDSSWWKAEEGIKTLDRKNVTSHEIGGQRYYDLLAVMRQQSREILSGRKIATIASNPNNRHKKSKNNPRNNPRNNPGNNPPTGKVRSRRARQ